MSGEELTELVTNVNVQTYQHNKPIKNILNFFYSNNFIPIFFSTSCFLHTINCYFHFKLRCKKNNISKHLLYC